MPTSSCTRISLAIAASLGLHGLLIFLAPLTPPAPLEPPLPPLMAKLEPLPIHAAPANPAKPRPKPRPKPVAAPIAPSVEPPPSEPLAESVEPLAESTASEMPTSAVAEVVTPETSPNVAAAAQPAHPLPKHAQLTFSVYQGSSFKIGEATHRLAVDANNHYTLSATVRATGVVGLLKKFSLSQISTGEYSAQGLIPHEFSEIKDTSSGLEQQRATFDWVAQQLTFVSGNSVALPALSQDFVSFLYQLSQLPLENNSLPIFISNGKKLERYELAIGEPQDIATPIGKIRALPFRKVHALHEEGLEVWLGLEYRLLPVKISQLDGEGRVLGEMVIRDIRVSDE